MSRPPRPVAEPEAIRDPLRPAVVLVHPQEEGNVGATARAMANLGLDRLILVEPAVEIGDVALARAVGARHVLLQAHRAASLEEALAPFHRAVGTTSTRDRNLPSPIGPRELPPRLAAEPGTTTAIVFGPESSGLTNDQLAGLDPVVRVPCSREQPTLNLSQAVVLVAWEIWSYRLTRPGGDADADAHGAEPESPPATAGEVEGLLGHVRSTLEAVGFARDGTAETALRDLRRLASRARLTPREVTLLRGICRRASHASRRLPEVGDGAGGAGAR